MFFGFRIMFVGFELCSSVFELCSSVLNYVLRFRIMFVGFELCSSVFELCSSVSNYVLRFRTSLSNYVLLIGSFTLLDRSRLARETNYPNHLRAWVNSILQQLNSVNFDSDSQDSVFYRVESLYNTVATFHFDGVIAIDDNIVNYLRQARDILSSHDRSSSAHEAEMLPYYMKF